MVAPEKLRERDGFAAVAQGAGKGSGDAAELFHAIAGLEGIEIFHDEHVIARIDFGDVAAGENEGDAQGEARAGQIDSRVARVFQLEELEIGAEPSGIDGHFRRRRLGRIVIDFAHHQIGNRSRHIDDELRLVEGRPDAAAEPASADQRGIGKGDRPGISQSRGADAAAGQTRIGTVERVVDRPAGRAKGQRKSRRDVAAAIAEDRRGHGRKQRRSRAVAKRGGLELVQDDRRPVAHPGFILGHACLPVVFRVRRFVFGIAPPRRFGDDGRAESGRRGPGSGPGPRRASERRH